ncbi:hypothetical protein M7775_05770 [Sporomusa sphaeroides DSM 2875]|uniref:hypothetical protein n=1 Tax=Sporomusa sphaeroides TaxID=47679 RepID=UPI00202FF709|nr:hypothetical protein [Sporomusa sphaeroides]MCM0758084.1 hypothetical protein [Sporomusa sphaeroides DSM 2875]
MGKGIASSCFQDLTTNCPDCGNKLNGFSHAPDTCIDNLRDANADLRAKLEAAEERLARVDAAIPEILALADEVQKVEIENRNLQAAYEVVRGALEVVNVAVEELFTACPEEAFDTLKTNTRHAIDLALSTTPEQAGKRVRGLVEAAENVRNSLYDALPTGNATGDRYFMVLIRAIRRGEYWKPPLPGMEGE